MATVNLNWTTKKVTVPADTDLAQYRVAIDGIDVQNVPFGTLTASFLNVAPGDYIARVALANKDNSHLDFEISQAFNVPTPTVELDGADVISVSLS